MDMPAITTLQPAPATTATSTETETVATPFEEVLAAELEDAETPAEETAAVPSAENALAENADPAPAAGGVVTDEMLAVLSPASSATPPSLTVPATPASESDTVSADADREAGLRPTTIAASAAGKSFRPADETAHSQADDGKNLPLPESPIEGTAAAAETAIASSASTQTSHAAAPQAAGPVSAAAQPASPAWVALPPASHGSPPAPALEVTLPVQHRDWASKFSERVTLTVSEGLQSAELRVNPEELGPVRIRVSLDRNEASLVFAAAHPLVRAAIEDALPALRESLQQAGLQLGETFVAGGQPQGGQEQGSNRSDPARGDKSGESQAVMAENVRHVSASLLVDTYA